MSKKIMIIIVILLLCCLVSAYLYISYTPEKKNRYSNKRR